MIYHIDRATSSNDVARDAQYVDGDIVRVEHQTAGRGQRGHTWSGGEKLDLTFSLVLTPTFLRISEQFIISRVTALALVDTFAAYGIRTRIKWTNDIYAGDRKITGILIENDLSGDRISKMIIGIGINVNRREFDPSLPNPTSMAIETGRSFDRMEVLATFAENVMRHYDAVKSGGAEEISRRYDSLLYRLNERCEYALPDGGRFFATIRGTEPSGLLILEHTDGSIRSYAFREAEFVIKR